ncbi:MAG: CPBP family intramembrane metalloprotease [Gammaproteobacteria bacterium]|nr:CPBP family intramembrane metalloprotease [Gammaproteobacteria bacterium]
MNELNKSISDITTIDNRYRLLIINYIFKFFKSTTVLLGFSFAFIHLAFYTPHFYPARLGEFNEQKLASIIFLVGFTFLIFFILPAIAGKYILQEKLKNLGLAFPEKKLKALLLTLAALLILIPLIVLLTKQPEFQSYYSLKQPKLIEFAFINIALFPFYYFSEEFFFRGFLFLGLWNKIRWHSFWVTDLIFAYAHLGKPGFEILLSMFASVVFNILTLNTKSIYPAMITHWTMGTTMLFLVNINH